MNTSPSLSPPGSDLDGLELESLRASRDHAPEAGIALDGNPRAPAESFDLEPGESYAKWAAERGPQTLGYLLGVADHAAGYDDPGMDAALGALFILSRRAIRAALSSAKPVEREGSRDELLDRLSQLEAELKRRDDALRPFAEAVTADEDGWAINTAWPAEDDWIAAHELRAALQPQEGGDA